MKATFKQNRYGHPYPDQPKGSNFPLRLNPPKEYGLTKMPSRIRGVAGGGLAVMSAGSTLTGLFMAIANSADPLVPVAGFTTLGTMVGAVLLINPLLTTPPSDEAARKVQEMIYFDGDSLIVDNSFDRFPKAFNAAHCRIDVLGMDFEVAQTGHFLRVSDDKAQTYIGTFLPAAELPVIRDMIDVELDHFRTLRPAQSQPSRRPPEPPPGKDFA